MKVNGNWRKQNNKELMQQFGELHTLSFVEISRLNWIGHICRMDSNREVSQGFNNNLQGSRLRGQPRNRCRNCVGTDY
jgi:hypothetical protein